MSERTRVIKIGNDAKVTLSFPGMTGRYLVVEEAEGQIVISPFDLRWYSMGDSIAKLGDNLHFVASDDDAWTSV